MAPGKHRVFTAAIRIDIGFSPVLRIVLLCCYGFARFGQGLFPGHTVVIPADAVEPPAYRHLRVGGTEYVPPPQYIG